MAVLALGAAPALACGGLVGENGTIELVRTTTLAAYSDGVERYVTAFEFTGEGEEVGSIIPLPDVPTKVERGGDWTLQRLAQEVAPAGACDRADSRGSRSAGDAEVILEVEIDALDITVLRGGGDEVGAWAVEHGFFLSPDAPEVLDFYAERSPMFMAARFDAERAAELAQEPGDSTPIMATIPTDDPWVPLRILGLGAEPRRPHRSRCVPADRDRARPAGRRPRTDARSQRAGQPAAARRSPLRHRDGMAARRDVAHLPGPRHAGGRLDYDLAVSATPGAAADFADTGVPGPESLPVGAGRPGSPVGRSMPAWESVWLTLAAGSAVDSPPPSRSGEPSA